VWDDEWKAPPDPTKPRLTVKGVMIAISLLVAGVALLSRGLAEPERQGAWTPATTRPVAAQLAPRSDTVLHAQPILRREARWEPDEAEVTEWSQPPRRPVAPVAPPRARAAPPPAARVGFLSVNSTPWAELSVDGRVVGSTPQIRIRVTPGRHRLLLVRDGFQPHSTWVDVAAGATVRVTDIALKASSQ
jgi:serine/threonine-protein kinase